MKVVGVVSCQKVNSTSLKERPLPYRSHSKSSDVLLTFAEYFGKAPGKACEQECDTEEVHLARAAQMIRQYMFEDPYPFRESFPGGCQEDSLPNLLVAVVNIVLDGPSIKNRRHSSSTKVAS